MRTKTLSNRTIHTVLIAVFVLSMSTWLISRMWLAGEMGANTIQFTILFLAYAKASLIIYHYMEIRWAPVWLKAACAGWVAISLLAIVMTAVILERSW